MLLPPRELVRKLLPGRQGGGRFRAVWEGVVVAESDDTVLLEGNRYFPRASLREEHTEPSSHTSVCPWKGRASYLHVTAGGRRCENAAWFYPSPSPAARKIQDRVAFWHGVQVERVG
jgi:uncharacterized protein (DUF427 family)